MNKLEKILLATCIIQCSSMLTTAFFSYKRMGYQNEILKFQEEKEEKEAIIEKAYNLGLKACKSQNQTPIQNPMQQFERSFEKLFK